MPSQQSPFPERWLLLALLLVIIPTGNLATQPELSGNEEAIFFCGELPHGSGLAPGEHGLVDRFNNVWHPSKKMIRTQQNRRSTLSDNCGGFRIDFEDVLESTGFGFDDRTPINHSVLGSTTLGELRRRTVCEVFRYISETIEVQGSPDIIVLKSRGDHGHFIATAGPFFPDKRNTAITSGLLHQHITTGVDPSPDPGDYDAMITFDFGYYLQPDWNATGPGLDLFSVTLHEATHALGFMSLISSTGESKVAGFYSDFDLSLRDSDGKPLIDPVKIIFQGTPDDLLSNALFFDAPGCGDHNPVYSPPAFMPGSSISHFDPYRSGIRYVMRPSTSGGEDRRYTAVELRVLCEIGYRLQNNGCGHCLPRGVDDFATTQQETEICSDVLANDVSPDGSPLRIDPASVVIEVGGGTVQIRNEQLCYTPGTGFVGVARLRYAPANNEGTGLDAVVMINVNSATPFQPGPRRDAMIWRFPTGAGIDFSSGAPTPMPRLYQDGFEGCASICDTRTGRLLFYTNGRIVWDATDTPMPNGQEVGGSTSSTQSSLIVPKPGDSSIYYLFLTGAEPGSGATVGVRYVIVDMRLNGGRGDVVGTAVELYTPAAEMLCATRHCNGRDYWVAAHETGSNKFCSYPVTPDGIGEPVYSSAGPTIPINNGGFVNWAGALKFSPDGRRAATTSNRSLRIDLFDFDRATGIFSNPVNLDSGTYRYYGVSFSPNGSRLYSTSVPHYVFQFNLLAGDANAVRASRTQLPFPNDNRWPGQLQIGPDRRIYMASASYLLGVVSDPDSLYPACNFSADGFHLQYASSFLGLPNLIDYDLFASTIDSSQLRITKRVSDPTPHYGDTLDYTITVCNVSECMAATDVVIEDQLPAGLHYIDGLDSYPYHTFDSIPAGMCRSVVLRALVTPDIPLAVPVTNCAGITQSTPDYGYIPLDSNCATITLHGTDLGITKEANIKEGAPGDTVTYTITVTNYGPEQATGILVLDQLPEGVTLLHSAITDGDGNFDSTDGTLSIQVLGIGQQAILQLQCRIGTNTSGTITNCAQLVWLDQQDLDITNDRSCVSLRADGTDLALTKSVDVIRPHMGDSVTYTITVINQSAFRVHAITVQDILPAGLSYRSHTIDITNADYKATTGLFHLAELDGGNSAVLHVTCVVDSSGDGDVINCAELVSAVPEDQEASNDRSCVTISPRWCNQPELTGHFSIPRDLHTSFDRIVEVPILLHDTLDDVSINRIRIAVSYDTTTLVPGNRISLEPITSGTLLDRWHIATLNRSAGVYTVELTAPASTDFLHGSGTLLRIPFRMYLGSTMETDLPLEVVVPDNRCVAALSTSGHIRLDSLCGLSFRLIDVTPYEFAIKQISPNPFNPTTDITFEIGLDGPARLEIFDINGRHVTTLVDGYLIPGTYSVRWDATEIPSGTYTCRLSYGNRSLTTRMILIK